MLSTRHLRCGVIAEQADFDMHDTHGNLTVFATDMCRALAAAVLGGPTGLALQGFPDSTHGLQALHDGKLDVLYGVTPRDDRAHFYRIAYGSPVFFDAQSVMARTTLEPRMLSNLAGAQVCFIGNTAAETTLTRALQARHIPFKPFPFQETGEMDAALVTGHCQAVTANASALAAQRTGFHARQQDFTILPDRLTIDPYAPALPANDTAWVQVVDAVLAVLVQAEANGITKANLPQRAAAGTPDDQDFLRPRGTGAPLGLADGWIAATITQAGNYGELFDRDLGEASPLRLARGPNRPWSQGGLFWTQP